MSVLQQFLTRVGSPRLDADRGYVQYRAVADGGGSGQAADIERIETDDGVQVVVTAWEWTAGARGNDRERMGRLVFNEADGTLISSQSEGSPTDLGNQISSMRQMVA